MTALAHICSTLLLALICENVAKSPCCIIAQVIKTCSSLFVKRSVLYSTILVEAFAKVCAEAMQNLCLFVIGYCLSEISRKVYRHINCAGARGC